MSEAARTQTGKNKLNRVQFLAIVESVFPVSQSRSIFLLLLGVFFQNLREKKRGDSKNTFRTGRGEVMASGEG